MSSPARPQASLIEQARTAIKGRTAPRILGSVDAPDTLFYHWLAYTGVLLFAAALLWQHNVWGMLVEADPTGITLLIIGIFAVSTIWCGTRIYRLSHERAMLHAWMQSVRHGTLPLSLTGPGTTAEPGTASYVNQYLRNLVAKVSRQDTETGQLSDILAERIHGPSETAWWINGIQIKLGLLGKVIGFSILALQIAQIENFDPSQTQNLLKSLTGGLGIALLTTAVGLVANILLGIQLVRLDRYGDVLLADTLDFVETTLPAAIERR